VVAHSFGGTALLKYLAENTPEVRIAGIFLAAAPYWAKGGWDYEGFTIAEDFPEWMPEGVPMFFYHNRDDESVPFAHLALYRERFPHATVSEGASGGHQFDNNLTQIAQDVKSLP
jgi:predicted alpha/beta hydrolase family esterase